MKFLALAALCTTSVFARIRDRNNGVLKLNEFCPMRKQIIKANRCGPGLECDEEQCKSTSGNSCISDYDCIGDLKCWSSKVCKEGVEVTTMYPDATELPTLDDGLSEE